MPTTRLDDCPAFWTCAQARTVLVAAGVFFVWSLIALSRPDTAAPNAAPEGGKDLDAYRRIVERVHHGKDYYSAAGDELRVGGYATSSVFNWRLPTYAWLLAALPRPEWGQGLLCMLALAALSFAYGAERHVGGVGRAIVLLPLMAGAFLWCIDGDAFFSQELWAGVLIAVSVGAFMVEQRGLGLAAGLAALFMRELAAPYVLVAFALACHERRWREFAVWGIGLAAFAVFLMWHAWQVQQHRTGLEIIEADGWIQFGGPSFVIQTCQMNALLFNLPAWVTLLYLLGSLLGFATWRGPTAVRIGATVGVYLLAFLVVGKPFNGYWGLLFVALLPLGLVRFPSALKSLAANARSFGPRLNESSPV